MIEDKLKEIIELITNYIETVDYCEAIKVKNRFVNGTKESYLDFLSKELKIEDEDIKTYVINNFENMSFEINKILVLRIAKQTEIKTNIVETGLLKEGIDNNQKELEIEDQLNENRIDYQERISRILEDILNDNVNRIKRILEYKRKDVTQVYEINSKFNSNINGFVDKLNEELIDLDKHITSYANAVVKNYIKELEYEKEKEEEEKFKDSIEVPNEDNRIETNALAEIEKEDKLNPEGIFESKEDKNISDKKADLDDKDIF